jgi:aspartate aminotransferase-like enzyme
MLRAGTGRTAGQNLAAVGQKAAKLDGVLIIDKIAFIGAELTNLLPLAVSLVFIESQGCFLLFAAWGIPKP